MIFSSSTMILSYVLRIFELPYFRAYENQDFDSYFNSMWCVLTTITTVGYGDVTPSTKPGRCIAMITAFWGAFLISILVVTVSSVFELNEKQRMALSHINLTRRAATTISSSIKYFLAKKRLYELKAKHNPEFAEQSMFMIMLNQTSQ